MVLAAVLSMLRYVAGSEDRDFVDRLHSYFTCNILIGLSVLVSFKQFGGKPIECLVPDTFSSSWEQYAESYCWSQDTYYVPIGTVAAGLDSAYKRAKRISYYQWVPFFLLLEAACFRVPSILWKYLAGHSGIKIHEVVRLSSDPNNIKPEIKKANIKSLTLHLQGALRFHRRVDRKLITPHNFLRMLNLPYSASFVTLVYLFTKLTYLFNVCFQLMLMNNFLETDKYNWYGFGAVLDLWNGTTWQQSGVFPRVSLCDFDVRVMGNVQEHTIQCVLVINIFNEKIFIFLWFWYMALAIFTAGSLLYWLSVACMPFLNKRFINRHLEMSEIPFDPYESEEDVEKFIKTYLRHDGVFVIRMLTLQSGVIFGTELVQALWKSFTGSDVQPLKRSNSVPLEENEPRYWPPPPEDHNPFPVKVVPTSGELRMRKALGANTDNTILSQDLLEKLTYLPKNMRNGPRRAAPIPLPVPVPIIVPETDYDTAQESSESQQLAVVRETVPLMSHIDSGRDTPV